MAPLSGLSWPTIMRNSVVLPAPFGPITPTMPPGGSLKERSSIRSRVAEALADVARLDDHVAEPWARRNGDLRLAVGIAARPPPQARHRP